MAGLAKQGTATLPEWFLLGGLILRQDEILTSLLAFFC